MNKKNLWFVVLFLMLNLFLVKEACAAPTATITNPSASSVTVAAGTSITLTGSGSGGTITGYEWRYYSTTGTVVSTTSTFTRTVDGGSYTYYFRVKDSANVWSSFDSVVLTALAPPSIESCTPCNAFTKKIDIGWYNYKRTSGSLSLHVGSSDITVPLSSTSYEYQGQNGRNYNVSITYTDASGNSATSAVKAASCYSCTGTIPANSTVCSSMCFVDDTNVTTDTAIRGVSTCTTTRKCEYECNSGYTWNGISCTGSTCTIDGICAANTCIGDSCLNNCGTYSAGTKVCAATPTPTATPTSGDGAEFVSYSNVPTSVSVGQTFTSTITMRNSGTTTWNKILGGSGGYKLGSQNPQDNHNWVYGRIAMPGDTVAPNSTVNFTRTFTAPATPGTYHFQWRMLIEGIKWFGAYTTNQDIVVTPASSPTPTPTPTPTTTPPPCIPATCIDATCGCGNKPKGCMKTCGTGVCSAAETANCAAQTTVCGPCNSGNWTEN